MNRIYDLAHAALDAVTTRWDYDAEPLPTRQSIAVGEVAWDCEQLIVAVESTANHVGDVAVEVYESMQAAAGFGLRFVTLGIWLVRCVTAQPTTNSMSGEVYPPTLAQLDHDASIVLADVTSITNAVSAAQKAGELAGCNGLVHERWEALGPAGGLVGGVLRTRASFI